MKALVFPGQGAQYPGMGKSLFEASSLARSMFATANEILGFEIDKIMMEGSEEDLMRTSVTQPAVYIHSVIAAKVHEVIDEAAMTAGHSLGEFSALVAAGAMSFEDGLRLVSIRAKAMQKACDMEDSTMAAILGLEDEQVEAICDQVPGVVAANYNTLGQLVISGSRAGIAQAIELAQAAGAKRALELSVNGAFHSPFMEPARLELAAGIEHTTFQDARIPVFQNVTAQPHTAAVEIQANLLLQLTAPVRWTQTIQHMLTSGATSFIEVGPGKVLSGLIKKVDRAIEVSQVS